MPTVTLRGVLVSIAAGLAVIGIGVLLWAMGIEF